MKPYISSGNRKMSYPTFSLPSKQTCPGCTALCSAKCYARKAELAYPQVLPSRKRNLDASRGVYFERDIIVEIKRRKPEYFRIHESGDFFRQWYLNKWCRIAEACPKTRFLAFTKSFALDYSNVPSNLVIIWSVWPDSDLSKVPPGPRAYAGDCGDSDSIECAGSCDACGVCWHAKPDFRVHFRIH